MKKISFFSTCGFLFLLGTAKSQTQLPFSGSPIAVPGIIEAENYDTGGEGISYSDATSSNIGGQYRNESVDIETSSNGGFNIHNIESGEWVEYTIDIPSFGNYKFEFDVAATNSTGEIRIDLDGFSKGPLSVPNTGGMQTWRTVKRSFGGPGLGLSAGIHVLRLTFSNTDLATDIFNFDKLTISTETQYAFGRNIIPGVIEAENFDLGGYSSGPQAFYDNSPGSNSGLHRFSGRITYTSDVDLETSSENGTNIGWIEAGEWVEYTVYVEEEGVYTLDARVASRKNSGSFQITSNGNTISDIINVPNTRGWQQYTTVSQSNIPLEAGTHTLRVNMTGSDFNFNYFAFTQETITIAEGCTGSYENDYEYEISGDDNNPTITFNPINANTGDNLVILYYGSGSGSFPGFIVSPGEEFEINASSGTPITFYYTFNVPEGGERNSSTTPHSFVVGNCDASSAREASDYSITSVESTVYPNPMNGQDFLSFSESDKIVSLKVIDNTGALVLEKATWNTSNALNLSDLNPGFYSVITQEGTEQRVFKIVR